MNEANMKFLILLLFTAQAQAAVTFTWTAPQPVDGASVSEYHLYCGSTSGQYVEVTKIPVPSTSHIQDVLPNGQTFCSMRSYSKESEQFSIEYSNEVIFKVLNNSIVKVYPNPPGQLKVKRN